MPSLRTRTKVVLTAVFVIVAALAVLAYKTSRFGTASPDYDVEMADGDFEIRSYPAMAVVSAPVDADGSGPGVSASTDSAFLQLFRYITGDNEGGATIAMTTPVLMDTAADGEGRMQFILPPEYVGAAPPQPTGSGLAVEELAGGLFASLRFEAEGPASPSADEALARLRRILGQRGLTAAGTPPIFAYYDPPWTPSFLRRNEVLLQLVP